MPWFETTAIDVINTTVKPMLKPSSMLLLTACLGPLAACAGARLSAPAPRDAHTPVERHGQLRVAGNRIIDASGSPAVLTGMSLFWTVWGGDRFFNRDVVDWLATDWRCSLLRVPVAVEPAGGYLSHPDLVVRRARTAVDAAIAKGLYVIIDWHEEHADRHVDHAKAFFAEMAKAYGHLPNVLFEIWNEPAGNDAPIPTWPQIKAYAQAVIPVIRAHSPNLIIVGTRLWSQRVDLASDDPVPGDNIAYTLHFYAGSHGRELRDKADYALAKGAALVITEWGTTNADGGSTDKRIHTEAATEWLTWAKRNDLSWANWSVMDKAEASSILLPDESDEALDGLPDKGHWPESRLTPSGKWVKAKIAEANGKSR